MNIPDDIKAVVRAAVYWKSQLDSVEGPWDMSAKPALLASIGILSPESLKLIEESKQ